ncbi:hypothetical protein [Streptomyces sp. KR80]|uniref:hypothetical protein n=1 Tax=Streptomyces sp. KR80 TaxID=3457426 RepID=UPI003FD06578
MTEHVAQSMHERLGLLEDQVQVLAQAVRALAQGLEELPSQETETETETKEKAARGARLAHELLLSQGM